MRLATLPLLLTLTAFDGQAASLFRCEDADGQLSFRQHGCHEGEHESRVRAHNPTPGSGKPIPLARPQAGQRRSAVVVVGERQDGCGNLLGDTERRTAIIQKRIRKGMTRADVESAFGRPDRISQQDARLRYHYDARPGQGKRSVTFDEFGCVDAKTPRKRR
ncbi:hypothetical protein [Pseudomonas citronellolis]|uniref:hypothetical protein n=1 Tax=Pseudomonas citronellolis TaxID=53408 RepID=UPI0023E3B3BC|nr:hypothetical protein [Pseudomonas citronellolis]MDF3935735.1 hypothetical protein [Pseudomonas citronellolis]